MTSKQSKLIETYIRSKVKKMLKETKKSRLNENYDETGEIWDNLQAGLYEQLDIILQKWARHASIKLKKYVKDSNGELDYVEIADEFFNTFIDNDYWSDAIDNYKR